MSIDRPPLVAHIVYSFRTGGMENGVVNILNRMPPERYRHAIVCLTQADDFADRFTVPGVRILSLYKRPGHEPGIYWRLRKTLRELRPAIVHTRNLAALEMQAVTLWLPRVRRIHGEHGRDIYDLDGSNWKYRLLRRGLNPLIHRYITVSRDLQQWLINDIGITERRVVQIYNGVDQQRFMPRSASRPALAPTGFLPDKGIVVGTVGRLAEVKDQKTLLRAVHLLLNRQPELRDRVRLVLIGDGPLFAELQRLTAELGIDDLVWMPGDRSDIPELLRLLDIFVLPSLAEGISNTVLEAMATGLPVIATRTGGNPELVEDGRNGYLVPVADPAALADTLAKMITDTSATRHMGAEGRRFVDETFNWDRTVQQYLSIYDEVLAVG